MEIIVTLFEYLYIKRLIKAYILPIFNLPSVVLCKAFLINDFLYRNKGIS